jgi:hypothetical protein
MNRFKATKKIAPSNSASNATPNLLVVASTQEDPKPFCMDVWYDTREYLALDHDAEPRKSRICMLAVVDGATSPHVLANIAAGRPSGM